MDCSCALLHPRLQSSRLISPLSSNASSHKRNFCPPSSLMLQNQFPFNSSHVQLLTSTRRDVAIAMTYRESSELADINWDDLGFRLVPTDYMFVMKTSQDGIFTRGELQHFGNIELSPSSGVLNYGQGLFEGLKAYRKEDGSIILFRPEENALRMRMGAERMCMAAPTVEQFVDAVKCTVMANKRWVPPQGGAGGVKAIGNYASVLKALTAAKAKGYSDVLYLDSVHKRYLEEVSICNVFVVKEKVISTPAIKGTILPGITRKSIIDVARSQGYQVEERQIPVEELLDADEVFCTANARPITITCGQCNISWSKGVVWKQRSWYRVSKTLCCPYKSSDGTD